MFFFTKHKDMDILKYTNHMIMKKTCLSLQAQRISTSTAVIEPPTRLLQSIRAHPQVVHLAPVSSALLHGLHHHLTEFVFLPVCRVPASCCACILSEYWLHGSSDGQYIQVFRLSFPILFHHIFISVPICVDKYLFRCIMGQRVC